MYGLEGTISSLRVWEHFQLIGRVENVYLSVGPYRKRGFICFQNAIPVRQLLTCAGADHRALGKTVVVQPVQPSCTPDPHYSVHVMGLEHQRTVQSVWCFFSLFGPIRSLHLKHSDGQYVVYRSPNDLNRVERLKDNLGFAFIIYRHRWSVDTLLRQKFIECYSQRQTIMVDAVRNMANIPYESMQIVSRQRFTRTEDENNSSIQSDNTQSRSLSMEHSDMNEENFQRQADDVFFGTEDGNAQSTNGNALQSHYINQQQVNVLPNGGNGIAQSDNGVDFPEASGYQLQQLSMFPAHASYAVRTPISMDRYYRPQRLYPAVYNFVSNIPILPHPVLNEDGQQVMESNSLFQEPTPSVDRTVYYSPVPNNCLLEY